MSLMRRIKSLVNMGGCALSALLVYAGSALSLFLVCVGWPLAAAFAFLVVWGFRTIVIQIERKRYWADKQPISDSAFLASLEPCTPEQSRFCLAVRKRIARSTRVAEQLVNAADVLSTYLLLGYEEPSKASIKKILKELGRRSTVDYLRQANTITLGDLLRVYLQNWDKLECVLCK